MPATSVRTRFQAEQFAKSENTLTISEEASSLGWPPGVFPEVITVENLGGQPYVEFIKSDLQLRDGIIRYTGQLCGWKLDVFND